MVICFVFKSSQENFSSRLFKKEFYIKEDSYHVPELKEKWTETYFDVEGYLNLRKVFIYIYIYSNKYLSIFQAFRVSRCLEIDLLFN